MMREIFYKTLENYGIPIELAISFTEITFKPTLKVGQTLYLARKSSEETGVEFARKALPLLYTQKKVQQAPVAAAAALFSLGIEGGFSDVSSTFWELPGSPWRIERTANDSVKIYGQGQISSSVADFHSIEYIFRGNFVPWILEEYGINLNENLIHFEHGQVFTQPRIQIWET